MSFTSRSGLPSTTDHLPVSKEGPVSPMSASSRPASRFVRLARICNRHRWRTFFAWVAALVAISFIANAVGTKEISSFRLPGTESQRAYDLLAQHFPAQKGDSDQVV